MLRPTTTGLTARAVRLLLLPALSSLALACDSSTPHEPLGWRLSRGSSAEGR